MPRADATERLRIVLVSCSRSELTDSLGDPSPEVARAAIRRLEEIEGRHAAPALRARLLDADLSLVPDIAKALRRIGDTSALDLAVDGLSDGSYVRRLAGARALGALADPRAADALRSTLLDDIAGVRTAALDALAQLGADADTAGACAPLLSDPDAQVRISAVRAVSRTATRPGLLLGSVADDEDRGVRFEVAGHLGGLPDPAAAALLADPDVQVREAAALASNAGQADVLCGLLIEDRSSKVRRAAARTLGSLDDERTGDMLVPGIEDPDAIVRVVVLEGLERALTHEGAARRLVRELLADRPERRRASVYALARLKTPEAATEIWRLADDPNPDVRVALLDCARTLLPDSEPLLRYMATDPNSDVRNSARNRLLRNPACNA